MEDLQILGKQFKTKREEMHLSLKEVENVTSIRKVYLQAIEEGRAAQFLSPVYALGFIKQYAVFLGYDPEELVKKHPKAFRLHPEKQEFSYGIGTLETRGSPGGAIRSLPSAAWIALTFLILVSAWYFAKFLGVVQ
ncbi:MAG: helix-turn-helix domain-containing protein [Chlamydiota bacterium]